MRTHPTTHHPLDMMSVGLDKMPNGAARAPRDFLQRLLKVYTFLRHSALALPGFLGGSIAVKFGLYYSVEPKVCLIKMAKVVLSKISLTTQAII
jgi:hypothetical protein